MIWRHCAISIYYRHMRSSGSCCNTFYRSAASLSATRVYFTPSDVRARLSVVMRVVIKPLPQQPRHVIRFSSRQLELQLVASCRARRWMFYRPWSPSSPALLYAGLCLLWKIFFDTSGSVDSLTHAKNTSGCLVLLLISYYNKDLPVCLRGLW